MKPAATLADIFAANDNDTGAAIRWAFRTMPANDREALQAEILLDLGASASIEGETVALFDEAPVEELRLLKARYFSDAALRRRALDERDDCLAAMSADIEGYRSGYALAKAIRAKLLRYESTAWRFQRGRPAPLDQPLALMHRILELDNGKVRSRRTIAKALAAVR